MKKLNVIEFTSNIYNYYILNSYIFHEEMCECLFVHFTQSLDLALLAVIGPTKVGPLISLIYETFSL